MMTPRENKIVAVALATAWTLAMFLDVAWRFFTGESSVALMVFICLLAPVSGWFWWKWWRVTLARRLSEGKYPPGRRNRDADFP